MGNLIVDHPTSLISSIEQKQLFFSKTNCFNLFTVSDNRAKINWPRAKITLNTVSTRIFSPF